MILDQATMRIHFNAGDLVKAQVVPAPMEEGWMILCTRKNGEQAVLTIARTTTPKVMRRLDTVRTALNDIGFRSADWQIA